MSTTESKLDREHRATHMCAHPDQNYAALTATTLLKIREPDLSDAVLVPRVARPRGHYGLSLFADPNISPEQIEGIARANFFYLLQRRKDASLWKKPTDSSAQPRVGIVEGTLAVRAFAIPGVLFVLSAVAGYSVSMKLFVAGAVLAYLLRVVLGSFHAAAVDHAINGPRGESQKWRNSKVKGLSDITGFDEKYVTPKLLAIFAKVYQHHGDSIEENIAVRDAERAAHASGFREAYKQVLAERYLPNSQRSPEMRQAMGASRQADADEDEFKRFGVATDPRQPLVNTNGNAMLAGGAFDITGQPFGS